MCDVATLQVIESAVQEKSQAGELFTAYDITRVVRAKLGRGVNVPHNDVKQEVHSLFCNGVMGSDYTRNLANLPGINPQPWVYHRITDDPSNYGNGGAVPASVSAAVAPALAAPVSTTSDGGSDDGVNQTTDGYFKVDGRETLCLPASLLRAAGLDVGDTANVSADALAGAVIVTKDDPDPSVYTALSSYTVDKYGNVRITQHTLQRAGCGGKEFEIDGDATKVVVRKHN